MESAGRGDSTCGGLPLKGEIAGKFLNGPKCRNSDYQIRRRILVVKVKSRKGRCQRRINLLCSGSGGREEEWGGLIKADRGIRLFRKGALRRGRRQRGLGGPGGTAYRRAKTFYGGTPDCT